MGLRGARRHVLVYVPRVPSTTRRTVCRHPRRSAVCEAYCLPLRVDVTLHLCVGLCRLQPAPVVLRVHPDRLPRVRDGGVQHRLLRGRVRTSGAGPRDPATESPLISCRLWPRQIPQALLLDDALGGDLTWLAFLISFFLVIAEIVVFVEVTVAVAASLIIDPLFDEVFRLHKVPYSSATGLPRSTFLFIIMELAVCIGALVLNVVPLLGQVAFAYCTGACCCAVTHARGGSCGARCRAECGRSAVAPRSAAHKRHLPLLDCLLLLLCCVWEWRSNPGWVFAWSTMATYFDSLGMSVSQQWRLVWSRRKDFLAFGFVAVGGMMLPVVGLVRRSWAFAPCLALGSWTNNH